MELLEIGRQNRTTSATEANEVSSRSHAVLQVFFFLNSMNNCVYCNPIDTELVHIFDIGSIFTCFLVVPPIQCNIEPMINHE